MFKLPKLDERGIAHFLIPLILLIGLIIGVYLVTSGSPLKLFSKATNPPIVFKDINGNSLPQVNGIPQSSSATVRVELISPFGFSISKSQSSQNQESVKGVRIALPLPVTPPPNPMTPRPSFVPYPSSCAYGSTQARLQKSTSDPWENTKIIDLGQQIRVGGFHNNIGVLASDVKLQISGDQSCLNGVCSEVIGNPDNGAFITPNTAGKHILTVTTNGQSGTGCKDTVVFQVVSSPVGSVSPTPSPFVLTTVAYKIAENPTDLAAAPAVPYVSEPTVLNYTFKDASPGQKFIWVEFLASDGTTEERSAQIQIIAEQPTPNPNFNIGVNVTGITHYGGSDDLLPYSNTSQIASDLAEMQRMGSKVIRVFVANENISDDAAAARLDAFLTQAALYNISVVASLIDFYKSGFGPQGVAYNRCDFTPCLLGQDFFIGGFKTRYKSFVGTVVSLNKNHNNIYAWEIGNELKYESDSNIFVSFMNEMSAYIKGIDPVHPISTGMMLAVHTGLTPDQLYPRLSNFDVISVHSYDGGHQGAADATWVKNNKKILLVGEIGLNGTSDRSTSLNTEINYWKNLGASSVLQWGFIAKGLGDNGNGDRLYGMDTIWHSADYDKLTTIFQALNSSSTPPPSAAIPLSTTIPLPTPIPLSTSVPFVCNTCATDVNKDGKVNLQDFSNLISCFNKKAADLYNNKICAPADINGDGAVNVADFQCLRAQFGKKCNTSSQER